MRVGSFNIESGKMVISDPRYELSGNCQILLGSVKRGRWVSNIEKREIANWGKRVCSIEAIHFDHRKEELDWEDVGQIGVNSGQVGFFDTKHYQDDSVVPTSFEGSLCPDEPWHSLCDAVTFDGYQLKAGTIPFGVVSSSGFGSGGYPAYVAKDAEGTVIGVRVVFIDDKNY